MNQKMKITEVKIDLIKPNEGIIAFASLVVDDNIFISSIAIHKKIDGSGYRLTYPSKGKFTITHPINKETSLQIEQEVFAKLKEVMKKAGQNVQILQS